jgi:glycosyltransferase involved in cell wall biosynthesis
LKTPFLSIIITVFNAREKLQIAIGSIFSQTFTDYEVIVIDGLSTDGSVELIKSYKKEHNHFKFVSEVDKGIYDAMNKGIDIAKGEWLYFLGSDDYIFENSTLEKLIEIGDLENYDFVYGNVFSPGYGENYDGYFDQQKILSKNICHQAIFVRKKLFQSLGKFDIRYELLADYDFNLRAVFNRKVRKRHIDLTVAFYAPAGSSSVKTDEKFIKDKNFLFLKYGFASFSWPQRIHLCRQILIQAFSNLKRQLARD